MERSYKFRIYPTQKQEELIQKTFGCARYVYNRALAERISSYKETGKTPTRFEQDRSLTGWKKELDWLREPDCCALQYAIRSVDVAFINFFRRCKNNEPPGFPKFKSKKERRRSYHTRSCIKVLEKAVSLPKLGDVKCRVSREVKGRVFAATVSQKPSGKYFVSLSCKDIDREELPKTGSVAGVDLGVKSLAITSDGAIYENPKNLERSMKRLALLQRRLSRKPRGSNNREKARVAVAKMHEKISDRRKDALQKLTTDLIRKYDVICLENLSPSNLVKNHRMARSISDASWGEIKRQLTYKADWYGKKITVIDPFYPSSQICSSCGERFGITKDLSVRSWTCPSCGTINDRDINAAVNILHEGMMALA